MLEVGNRNLTENSYTSFWDWFLENESELYAAAQTDTLIDGISVVDHIQEAVLEPFDDISVGFVYDPKSAKAYLSFYAYMSVERGFLVERIIKSAPSLPNWVFVPHVNSPISNEILIELYGIHFKSENLHFYPIIDAKKPDEVNIMVVHDDLDHQQPSLSEVGVQLFLNSLLGELEVFKLIDKFQVEGKSPKQPDLIPISRLKSYVEWREKEFVEAYDSVWDTSFNTAVVQVEEHKQYQGFFSRTTLNLDLLKWHNRPAYPWMLRINLDFQEPLGFDPDDKNRRFAKELEVDFNKALPLSDGYVQVAYVEFDSSVTFYFACKEFIKAAEKTYEVLDNVYHPDLPSEFEITKDKYWRTFDKFMALDYDV